MRVLVTGGTGLVGRVVLRTLAAAGHAPRMAVRSMVAGLPADAVCVGDIGPSTEWSRALEDVDAVVHLAARVHVMRDHAGGRAEFFRTNTEGTLGLARAAAMAGARRFVFVSTIKVSGESTTDRPFRAEDPPAPADAYAESKLAAESGLREIDALDPVIVRPPLVYGPGAKGNLKRLCRLARTGLPMPFAAIDNRRDLVGVANLASLIERCLTHGDAPGHVFLASDGCALSTPDLYRIIADAFGRPAPMFSVPVRLMEALARPLGLSSELHRLTQSLELDISESRAILGWAPEVSVAAGIRAMARASSAGQP